MSRVSKAEGQAIVDRCVDNHEPQSKKLVYLAGPLTYPDPLTNVHRAVQKADALHQDHPDWLIFVPHMNCLWELISPKDPEYWYSYDLHILERCDLLYRMVGYSTGADGEVKIAEKLGIPVIFECDE